MGGYSPCSHVTKCWQCLQIFKKKRLAIAILKLALMQFYWFFRVFNLIFFCIIVVCSELEMSIAIIIDMKIKFLLKSNVTSCSSCQLLLD